MTDFSLSLRGMELLTIQYLLDGKNSAYGYRFELLGLDKADFSGSREEEMLDTNLVQQAEEAGDLRKVKFYITNRSSPADDRAIQLNFYEDGHVTATKEARPEEYDEIVDSIATTKQYSQYLISLDDRIDDYIQEVTLRDERRVHRSRVNREFEQLIESGIGVSPDQTVEMHIYKMILANIGLQLYSTVQNINKKETSSEVPEAYAGSIKSFFTNYAQYQLSDVDDRDYPYVANGISDIIDNSKDTGDENPSETDAIELLQAFIDTYDIDH